MKSPDSVVRRAFCVLLTACTFFLPVAAQPTIQPIAAAGAGCERPPGIELQLQSGQVLVDCQDINGIKYVVGRIWVDQSPDKCWPTMVNPFEFQRRICKRMKKVIVMADEPDMSVLDCTIGAIFPIADFDYVVESHYSGCRHVDFHRISGSFREFRGFWDIKPVADGSKSEVTYSIFIDPGFAVPDWLVRLAVRCELPCVLTALRDRISYLKTRPEAAARLTLKAASASASPATVAASAAAVPIVSGAPGNNPIAN